MREQLRRLVPSGSKLHWRQLDSRSKKQCIDVLSSFDVAHIVVAGAPLDARRQERARAACMERLLFELGELGVTSVLLEARTESLNRRDMRLIEQLRGKRSLPRSLRVDIGLPSTEPMLWIPDQVLGALGDAKCEDGQWAANFTGL